MKSNLLKRLKKKAPRGKKLIQARIDEKLYAELRKKLKEENIKIADFIEAAAGELTGMSWDGGEKEWYWD